MNYLAITPVKDEELYLEHTLRSMIAQNVKPIRWIIVDDGSVDRTPDLVQKYAKNCSFIQLIRNERRTARQTGVAEVLAFNAGLALAEELEFDCVVKLDGDLSFGPDYFQRLLARFAERPQLGIASGVYLEQKIGKWRKASMPPYHAAGACKMIRRSCFTAIGGFVAERGWDTVDEIRAMSRGWQTTHFADLEMNHWKPEGSGMGMLHTAYMHGEIFYRTGGKWFHLLLKCLNRLGSRPVLAGGLAMFWGYLHTWSKQCKPLVTHEEACAYRALLSDRLRSKLQVIRSGG